MLKKCVILMIVLALYTMSIGAQVSTLTISGSPPAVLYDPNWGSRYTLTGTIIVRRTTTGAGDPFTIDLTPISTARNLWFYNGDPLNTITVTDTNTYVIAKGNPNNRDIAKTWGSEIGVTGYSVWSDSFKTNETEKRYDYFVNFRHDSALAHGMYQFINSFRLRAEPFIENSLPVTSVIGTLSLASTVVVGSAVFINFQDTAGMPIDKVAFTETSTMTRDFSILAQVNFVHKLSVRSTNLGVLRHQERPNETIPYRLWVKNMTTEVPLASGIYYFAQNQPKTSQTPATYSARILIDFDNLQNYTAGRYSDVLVFKIEA